MRDWLTFGLTGEEEDRYRNSCLPADLAQARICIGLTLAPLVVFAVNDYGFFGLSWRFYGLQALRLALFVYTVLFLKGLRGVTKYRSYDRTEFAWGLIIAVVAITVAATRPEAFIAHAIVVVVAVFVTVLAVPNRFVNQLTVSLVYTAGETLVVAPNLWTLGQGSVTVLLSVWLANSIAIACGWQLHSRRRREFLAREAEQRAKEDWEQTFNTVPDCVAILDDQHRVVRANRAMAERLGVTTEQCVGLHCYEAVHGTTEPPKFCPHTQTCGDHREHTVEVHEPRLGGDFLVSTTPRLDAEGRFTGAVHIARDVTERKRVESTLREREERLQRFYEAGLLGVIYWDMNGQIRDANDKFLEMVGYQRTDLAAGRIDWVNMTPPEYRRLDEKSLEELKATGVNKAPFEKEYLRKDGTRVPVIVAGAMLDEARSHGVAFVLDITERKRAEEAVRESERRLAGVLESMPDAFVSFDRELRYTYVNENAARLQNAHREDLLGRDVRAVYPDPESYKTISQYERVLAEQAPITFTSYHAGFDRWVEVRAFPTPDGVSVFYKDVSDIIKAEQALRQSEERLRLLGDNLPDSAVYQYVHEIDGSVRFLYVSEGIERLNGVSVADVLRDADTLHRQSPPECIERVIEAEARSKRELSDFDMELPMRRPDGEVRWMRLHSRPRRMPDGCTVWDGVQIDVTERKRAEEQIRAALAEKEVLLKEIHHRVKNNMQVISSLVALQADRLPDDAMRSALRDVSHRVRSMALVHEKLYQSTDMAQVEFAEYAQSLLNYLWRAHGTTAAGVRLVLELEPVRLSVNAAVPCGLILNELASNALKHAFRDGGHRGEAVVDGEVTVSLRGAPNGEVGLRVRDNGIGLPPGLDWRQADSLGLRLVQMLAAQLHAAVDVGGGEGTEFTVTFGKRRQEDRQA